MGRLTEAAAASGGASAARSAGPSPTPLPLSSTFPGCTATMASSEEDGTNGGASEPGEEKEATGKRRRLGLLATVWLTFYNIAMTAGYVRREGPFPPSAPLPALLSPDIQRLGRGRGCGRSRLRGAASGQGAPGAGSAGRRGGRGAGRGRGRRPWGRGAGAAAGAGVEWSGVERSRRAGRGGRGPARRALPNTVHGVARRLGARAGG